MCKSIEPVPVYVGGLFAETQLQGMSVWLFVMCVFVIPCDGLNQSRGFPASSLMTAADMHQFACDPVGTSR